MKQQQLLENESIGRWMEIYKEGHEYKQENKACVKLDNLLLSYVKVHRAGRISDDTYFDLCSEAIRRAWSPFDTD